MADLVAALGLAPEVGPVQVVDQREDAPADRDAWFAFVSGLFPGVPEHLDLLGLQLVERDPGVLGEERRAHQVHALLGRPLRGCAGAGTPPDAVAEAGGVRFDSKQPWWVGEHRPGVRLGEPLALDHLEEATRVLPGHVGVVRSLVGLVPEVPIPVDDLLR